MKAIYLAALLLLSACASQPTPVPQSSPEPLSQKTARKMTEWQSPAPTPQLAPEPARARSAIPAEPRLAEKYRRPISLALRDATMTDVISALSKITGLNFVLDQDVSPDLKVTVVVKDLPFEEALALVLKSQQLERQIVSPNTIAIYPAQADRSKAYRTTVTRAFSLVNADAKQVQNVFKQVLKAKDIYVDERLNMLVLRDTPDVVRQAEFLIARLDAADPEVMLEVEVLEISRNRLQELGLKFPDQVGLGLLQGTTTSTVLSGGIAQTATLPGGQLAPGFVDLQKAGALTAFAPNPLLLLNLRGEDGDGNLLANPRIRVRHREKARIHIGEKLPVFTTTSTANVGVSASVSYLDVGLKLDIEPWVHDASEVGIKMGLEVSSVVREVSGPQQSLAYLVGTRSTSTSLRLLDGQTQILAGLISDEERQSVSKIPGLGDLPVIGRLFSSHRKSKNKTEIVLLITPRIIRAPFRPPQNEQVWTGGRTSLSEGSEPAPVVDPVTRDSAAPAAAAATE